MADYRDLGEHIFQLQYSGQTISERISVQNESVESPTNLTFKATHYAGGSRLPYLRRSFISFKFGDKFIEDFDLIATVSDTMLDRTLTANFDDLTTTYDVLNGLMFHDTIFSTNLMLFHLSTDGMDERKLEEFKTWFSPGKTRELILSEHPNRAIMARVSEPPTLSMIPFEKSVTFNIGGNEYKTSTTEYKGTIELSFVMDEPFWYSKINIFGIIENNVFLNKWEEVDFFGSGLTSEDKLKDVLKIVYEDGIPILSLIDSGSMLFGNNLYSAPGERVIGKIAKSCTAADYNNSGSEKDKGYYNNGLTNFDGTHLYYCGAVIENSANPTYTQGVIFGAFIQDLGSLSYTVAPNDTVYFYYAGNAPAPFDLEFTIETTIDNDSKYLSSIYNKYKKSPINLNSYNTITFESLNLTEIRIVTPNFYSSYNRAIYIFSNMSVGVTWELVRLDLRDLIRHSVIRSNAINIVNSLSLALGAVVSNTNIGANFGYSVNNYAKSLMSYTLLNINGGTVVPHTFHVKIDTKNGLVLGDINYTQITFNTNNEPVYTTLQLNEENVSDMLGSNHLFLLDKNYFSVTPDGSYLIIPWNENGKSNSHRLGHDFPVQLNNFKLTYKYMYY